MFKNLHQPAKWEYELEGRTYIKVGAYGLDDMEYQVNSDGSVYLPESEITYTDLQSAYMKENQKWLNHEEQLDRA